MTEPHVQSVRYDRTGAPVFFTHHPHRIEEPCLLVDCPTPTSSTSDVVPGPASTPTTSQPRLTWTPAIAERSSVASDGGRWEPTPAPDIADGLSLGTGTPDSRGSTTQDDDPPETVNVDRVLAGPPFQELTNLQVAGIVLALWLILAFIVVALILAGGGR